MALPVFKGKSKKMNMISRKDDLNLCFSTDFELFHHFGKLRKISFQKINRLIVSLINRFFFIFRRFSWFMLGKVLSQNFQPLDIMVKNLKFHEFLPFTFHQSNLTSKHTKHVHFWNQRAI
jgi:hypothetical protein